MLVLGIDPGLAVTGWGIVEDIGGGRYQCRGCGAIRTDSNWELPRRLSHIYDSIRELIGRYSPNEVAVENVFQGKNVQSAFAVGHARAAAIIVAAQLDLPVAEYSPRLVKQSVVGRGGASKEQVGFMVCRILGLDQPPRPADAADAVGIALSHHFQRNRRALEGAMA